MAAIAASEFENLNFNVVITVGAALAADLIHPHQRCGYSDSPFARKDIPFARKNTFPYCRVKEVYFSILQGPEMG